MKACNRCGVSVADSAIKCPSCRSLLVAPPPATVETPSYAQQWSGGFATGHAAPAPVIVKSGRGSITRWIKRSVRLALMVIAAILAYGFASGWRESGAPYSQAHRSAFVSGCKDAGASESACNCSFDWIKQNIPAADFTAYVKAANTPGYTPSQAPPWVYQAGALCGIHE